MLPHIPLELQSSILSYAMTNSTAIVDPLSKVISDRLLPSKKNRSDQIAIHFLATCKQYRCKGTIYLWENNTFIFTTPDALDNLADKVSPFLRNMIRSVNFRLIPRSFEDAVRFEEQRLSRKHRSDSVVNHPGTRQLTHLHTYYYQLTQFLEAILLWHDPTDGTTDFEVPTTPKRPRLLPNLKHLRIDFVVPKRRGLALSLNDLAHLTHSELGRSLQEVVMTGLPSDSIGKSVCNNLGQLLEEEGLLISHQRTITASRDGLGIIPCNKNKYWCSCSRMVIRISSNVRPIGWPSNGSQDRRLQKEFPPIPQDESDPHRRVDKSCHTIWKKVPIKLEDTDNREWQLFDRINGLPWVKVETELDSINDFVLKCANCGQTHHGAISDNTLVNLKRRSQETPFQQP